MRRLLACSILGVAVIGVPLLAEETTDGTAALRDLEQRLVGAHSVQFTCRFTQDPALPYEAWERGGFNTAQGDRSHVWIEGEMGERYMVVSDGKQVARQRKGGQVGATEPTPPGWSEILVRCFARAGFYIGKDQYEDARTRAKSKGKPEPVANDVFTVRGVRIGKATETEGDATILEFGLWDGVKEKEWQCRLLIDPSTGFPVRRSLSLTDSGKTRTWVEIYDAWRLGQPIEPTLFELPK